MARAEDSALVTTLVAAMCNLWV